MAGGWGHTGTRRGPSGSAQRRAANAQRASVHQARAQAEAVLWKRWEHVDNQPARRAQVGAWPYAPRDLISAAVRAWVSGEELVLLNSVEPLLGAHLCGSPAGVELLATELADAVEASFARGWQPLDLCHVVGRMHTDGHRALVVAALHLERSRSQCRHTQPEWDRQLAQLHIPGGEAEHASMFVSAQVEDLADQMRFMFDLRRAVEVLAALRQLPALPTLIAPPHEGPRSLVDPRVASSHVNSQQPRPSKLLDERVLARVRGLLAKAESTTFDDEADALTTKAQELMARHAIDLALLEASSPTAPGVEARRVHIDDPYFDAKSVLLTVVAETNQCTAVSAPQFGIVTVFGFPADIEITELLFTSLLTQATSAMVSVGRAVDRSGSSRTKSFRRSFLLAFAMRIGERLRSARQAVTDEVTSTIGEALLPVLASRVERVAARQAEVFPNLKTTRSSVSNAAGWHAGRDAADRASLQANPRGIPRAR